jgi:hypothetical protein
MREYLVDELVLDQISKELFEVVLPALLDDLNLSVIGLTQAHGF